MAPLAVADRVGHPEPVAVAPVLGDLDGPREVAVLEGVGQRLGEHAPAGRLQKTGRGRLAVALEAQVHAGRAHPLDQRVASLERERVTRAGLLAQLGEQHPDVAHGRSRGVADDRQRLLGAVGVGARDVPRPVRLRGHHRPGVRDQVVHVGGDPAALLLLLVEVAQPSALDRLEGGVGARLHGLATLPPQVPDGPGAQHHHRRQRGERQLRRTGGRAVLVTRLAPGPDAGDDHGHDRTRRGRGAAVGCRGGCRASRRAARTPRTPPPRRCPLTTWTTDAATASPAITSGDQPPHGERGPEQHRDQGGPGQQLQLHEADEHREGPSDADVEEQTAAARARPRRPTGRPSRSWSEYGQRADGNSVAAGVVACERAGRDRHPGVPVRGRGVMAALPAPRVLRHGVLRQRVHRQDDLREPGDRAGRRRRRRHRGRDRRRAVRRAGDDRHGRGAARATAVGSAAPHSSTPPSSGCREVSRSWTPGPARTRPRTAGTSGPASPSSTATSTCTPTGRRSCAPTG